MTAQECYDAVMKQRQTSRSQQKAFIYETIRSAVRDGRLDICIEMTLDSDLQIELEDAGFKISTGSTDPKPYIRISWDQK